MKLRRRRPRQIGAPPGQLETPSEADEVRISRYRYDAGRVLDDRPADIEAALEERWGVTWINLDGIPGKRDLERMADALSIHPLVLEDMQTNGHRPTFEDYGQYLFVVFTMLSWNEAEREIREEQVSLLLFDSLVITVQQRAGDVLEPLRRRISVGGGRIRRMGADYLAFALLDVVVDNYYPVLEHIDDETVHLEEDTLRDRADDDRIYGLRRELIDLRRLIWPLRNVLAGLKSAESDLLTEDVRPFLADLHDNGIGVLETFEVLRDHIAAVTELLASRLSTNLNVVMKTLTVIASIFIPLTFIAGIYGMNFAYMPELTWRYGYFAVLGVMAFVAVVMVLLFRRRRWI
ncbi:MAG: magnesium/cobalt transporter CorA [Spirochaetes bacterium]|nr:magnesium/cobalt transporter CorA [Spirochaetota bacterium]